MKKSELEKREIESIEYQSDAISYIKSSTLFTDGKYKWLHPLIEKVLNKQFEDNELSSFLGISEYGDELINNKPISKSLTYSVLPQDIKRITSIDKVCNVGLVDIKEPIKLERGLNIFYGKNGSGKSSIYQALCKIFGKDKEVNPNLDKEEENSICVIKYQDSNGKESDLSWETGNQNTDSRIMIFDGEISQFLVDEDQDNKFEIAHLKLEYFSFLRDLYEKVENHLTRASNSISRKIADEEIILKSKTPFLFEPAVDLENTIKTNAFTENDKNELIEKENQIELIKKDNNEAVIKNLENARNKAFGIIVNLLVKNSDGSYKFKYNEQKIAEINTKIEKLLETKKVLEESNKNKISKLIPVSWVSSDNWTEFIKASINFVESLNSDDKSKFESRVCVYCQQPLSTDESKKLIEAYGKISKEQESGLKNLENEINEVSKELSALIEWMSALYAEKTVIESEFVTLGVDKKISSDSSKIKAVLIELKTFVDELKKYTLSQEKDTLLTEFSNEYLGVYEIFNSKIEELQKVISSKKSAIDSLNQRTGILKNKRDIKENEKTIHNYLDDIDKKKELSEKIETIYHIKNRTSHLASEYSKTASLKEFGDFLKKEYDKFRFTPPSSWNLKPSTRGGISKRTFALNEKRLSEIFSEGERKIHSLADFFAQCEINKYNGIYIFDDPVNSLDEDNIQYVANRIIELTESGNQVIVFTHNLYFLNALDKNLSQDVYMLKKSIGKQIIIESAKLDTTSTLKKTIGVIDAKMDKLKELNPPSTIEMGAVYDLISNYIEDYVEKKLFNNVVSRYRANIRMTGLSSLSDMPREKIKIISELYENASRGGNRHSNPSDIPEPTYKKLLSDYKLLKEKCNYS